MHGRDIVTRFRRYLHPFIISTYQTVPNTRSKTATKLCRPADPSKAPGWYGQLRRLPTPAIYQTSERLVCSRTSERDESALRAANKRPPRVWRRADGVLTRAAPTAPGRRSSPANIAALRFAIRYPSGQSPQQQLAVQRLITRLLGRRSPSRASHRHTMIDI